MSKLKWFHVAAVVLTLFLWERSASIEGGILPVLKYSVAGTLAGLGLVWIGRAFASLPFRPKTALLSAAFGLFLCTPVIALLIGPSTDTSNSAAVVLALTSAAAAAMAGALWGVVTLAGDAFGEWRHERSTGQLTLGGAHR
ncbi:MAG TPA: hypothetical protein VD758_08645 [Gemmatimonadaceae bacterium]|nr:hypothetical protein [Gemmatimonadaceae bacterium]